MKTSAGILLFKKEKNSLYYFLVHPGGPFWKNKDLGSWSIPKGEILPDENPLDRALKEFKEETGKIIDGKFIELSAIKQKGGKTVYAWALESDLDTADLYSNTFALEWPPKSGKIMEIPEVDQWQWFPSEEAQQRINTAQKDFIIQLENIVKNQ
ncbi:NUDIX hydrolase [Chryseobacterium flavum]|uniref:NUDIX hydrolase n=1 Tax=Chryseobacterium flavum TaxID=415851 RepID=A0A3D9CHP8_9FLAO|nr:NUDIX domain-containing protein [Chryseobacterium flavum]REC65271.1 NUDIX hydrolase [Chryseobacterium flavum]